MKRRKVRKRTNHSGQTTRRPTRSLSPAFVGVWEQVPHPYHTTTVVYRIARRGRTVHITAVDESDQSPLKISQIALSGGELRFQSLYPPTKHKAFHAMRLTAKDRATHVVTYTDEDGKYMSKERWRKRTDHSGSTFDSFLEQEGLRGEVEAAALNRAQAWQRRQKHHSVGVKTKRA